ncbi:MAG: hypothetical protein ABJC36_00165 [Gemmatimonadales bacterium]
MALAVVLTWPATSSAAQIDTTQTGTSSPSGETDSASSAAQPAFRFSAEAGLGLRALWEQSLSAKQERVACLGASIRNDTVFVDHILALAPEEADSMSISAAASVEHCGPPAWQGTVHTHVALYTADQPSKRFSAQDRGVMRQWYTRWNADGVFCVVYSARDAHCEADGVIGGMRSPPTILVR